MTGVVKQPNKQGKKTRRHKQSILTNRRTSRLEVDIRTQRGKQIKNEALCSAAIEISKQINK